MREKCFGGERSRATNSGRVLIAKRLRREGLLLHSPQNIPVALRHTLAVASAGHPVTFEAAYALTGR